MATGVKHIAALHVLGTIAKMKMTSLKWNQGRVTLFATTNLRIKYMAVPTRTKSSNQGEKRNFEEFRVPSYPKY